MVHQWLKRSLYQPIGAQQKHHPGWWLLLLLVCVLLLYGVKLRQGQASSSLEMLPTLLSLKDPRREYNNNYQYVHALANPVYNDLSRYPMVVEPNDDDNKPEIAVRTVLEQQQQQQQPDDCVSWTLDWSSSSSLSSSFLRPTDVFVFYQHDTLTLENIMEAATLQQLRYTFGGTVEKDNSTIHIPNVPRPLLHTKVAVLRRRRTTWWWWWNHRYQVIAKQSKSQKSQPLWYDRKTEPYHIHWAYTNTTQNKPTYTVRFGTVAAGTPVLRLLLDGSSTLLFKGTSTTYTNTDLCSPPANETRPGQFIPPGQLHSIAVSLPKTTTSDSVTYRVGLETGQGVSWSKDSFTLQTPNTNNTNHTYIVFGDQGCPNVDGAWQVGRSWMQAMRQRELLLFNTTTLHSVHHIGDLSYAQGAAHQWDMWLDSIQPLAVSVPWMIAVGNHEYDYVDGQEHDPSGANTVPYHPYWGNYGSDSGGECGVPTSKRFTMPDNGNGVFWYSYREKLAQFIVLSSEHDLQQGSVQQEWLIQTLKQVDRRVTPWLIVELHRPLYEPEKFWPQVNVAVALRDEIEFILYQYKVDAVFAGHYHAYHRSCDGLFRSKCHRGGPTHFTVGTAGARLDPGNVGRLSVPWSARLILQTYGYGRVTIPNATHLHFAFVKMGNATDDQAGTILDDVWIHRDRRKGK